MGAFLSAVKSFNSILWGPPMLVGFIGTGLLMSIRSGFFQLTHIKKWMGATLGAIFRSKQTRTAGEHSISQFQALSAALAACIGTGNIVGVSTALCAGGPGAVFWMVVSAVLGMMTACAENILGIKYRYRDSKNEWMGGAMVYMERGLGLKKTAKVFCVLLVISSLGIGNMTQANSVSQALGTLFYVNPYIVGAIGAVLVLAVIAGGIKRIAAAAEKLIPAMTVVFTLACSAVIFKNIRSLPGVISMIFTEAFSFKAAVGGAAGYGILLAARYGISRGVFSNEAGLGSSAIIHAAAETDSPASQGYWGILEVFLDTVVMCTVTALTVLVSGVWSPGGKLNGVSLCAAAFSSVFGRAGEYFICLSVCVFAFATLIGWSYYGRRGAEYLFGTKSAGLYNLIYSAAVFFGCVLDLELVWELSDLANGLMAVPNLISLCLLSGEATRELRSDNPSPLRRHPATLKNF